jgi:structural maintenance of chromosome 4
LSNEKNKRPAVSAVQHEDSGEELVDRLEKESETTLQYVQECRNRRRAIKESLRALSKTVKSLEIKLPKLNLEIAGCDTTRQELTKLIPELRVQCEVSEEDKAKRAALQAKVEQCKLDMRSCAILADRLEKEVSKLQQDIMEAGGPRLKKQKAACAKVVSKLNDSEKSLNSSKVEIVASEKAQAKAQKAREKFEKELEEYENSLHQKETEFKALEEGAFAVMQAFENVKVIEAEKKSALDSASKEAEELKESQAKIKCVEIDLLGQIDAFDKQISENRKKKNHWEKEIMRLQKVEEECDYELVQEPTTEEPDDMDIDEEDEEEKDNNPDDESVPPNPNDMPLSYAMLEKYDPEDVKEAIATLENERNMLAKNANMGAIAEYRKKESDYLARCVPFC